jgi:L-ribulokinase
MPADVSAHRRDRFVVGVDFGTLSGRAVVVRVEDGAECGTAVRAYSRGVMDERLAHSGAPLPPDWALQDPADYLDVLQDAVPKALATGGVHPDQVIGIATDFTACTVLPTGRDGVPLSFDPRFREVPHAYAKLWKHHAAQGQADRITALAEERGEPWLARYGGRISSEWTLAKGLELLEEDRVTYASAQRWIEAADWIVWQLCGRETRNVGTAGYKAQHQDGAFPSRDFLAALNPAFADFVADKIDFPLSAFGTRAGGLTAQAARWTGLNEGTAVAIGNVDAHVTAPAARVTRPGQLLAVMGTSTCHVMNADKLVEVPGMCGVVDGGIIDGLYGYEAGQSGVGDIFAWFVSSGLPPEYLAAAERAGLDAHEYLSRRAANQRVGEHGLIALDWHNGNRSVLVDHHLAGVLVGQSLATRPEDVYRALVEATAFGTRTIVETFEAAGVPVGEFVAAGGLVKNRFVMQTYADVLRRDISVIGSEQGPALGSAIHAADVTTAANAMGRVTRRAYTFDAECADAYEALYAEYRVLHDYFGTGGNDVLHRLRALRDRVRTS